MDIDSLIAHVKSEDVYEYCYLIEKYWQESKGHKKMDNKTKIKIEDYKNYLETSKIVLKPRKGLEIKRTKYAPKILIRLQIEWVVMIIKYCKHLME